MAYFSVVDWAKHQHYSKRNPPWIKLHRTLLDDPRYCRLDFAGRSHLVGIYLLAAKYDNRIPADPQFLTHELRSPAVVDLAPLLACGFIAERVPLLADCKQIASANHEVSKNGKKIEVRFSPRVQSTENREQKQESTLSQDGKAFPLEFTVGEAISPSGDTHTGSVRRIFAHWVNHPELVKHRALNKTQATAIQARLKEYTEQELMRAVDRYADLARDGRAPGFNQWGIQELFSRGSGTWVAKLLNGHYRGILSDQEREEESAAERRRLESEKTKRAIEEYERDHP